MKVLTGKAHRGSITFSVGQDGQLEQVIKLYKESTEPQSVTLLSTAHGKLVATKRGLSMSLAFSREQMDFDTIKEKFYAETDEMAEYLATHQPEMIEEIRKTFTAKIPSITILKGGEAA